MPEIPDRLKEYDLIKIYGPEADCNHPGKQPVGSSTNGPFYRASDPELQRHIENGGNVGFPLSGPFIVFDVDEDRFGELLDSHLPPTFSVRTGSGGEHRYYHAPDWSDNRKFGDLGSIRADGWQVVIPPSIHPETGNRYEVLDDRPIRSVGIEEIEAVTDRTESSQHSGGRASRAARVGGSPSGIPTVPEEYPNRPTDWGTARSWLDSNGFLQELNRSSGDRSAREFKLAKCLAEGGFSETVISDVLDRLPYDSKWHERGDDYRTRTVRNAIVAACDDPYVDFSSPGDMGGNTPESRKTDSGGMNPGRQGGDQPMPEFTDKLEATILEASEEGDSFRKVTLVEGNDNGDTFEYVALKKGQVQTATTTDGEEVLVENVQDSVSLGSPDYLGELVDGLEALQDKIEDDN